jgi:hypothetical protein
MRDVLGPGTILGYCTNVHAGATLEQTRANLEQYAVAVKRFVSPNRPMGVGLWLSHQASKEAIYETRREWLRDWLMDNDLDVFTLNAFPFGDFHEQRIKHSVYEPDWGVPDRVAHTVTLGVILRDLPGSDERSMSTLPIGWPGAPCRPVDLDAAVRNLLMAASMLKLAMDEHGLLIHLDLEPEPGCILQRSDDVVAFFNERLLRAPDQSDLAETGIREHLRVCHDICHAAVMFEDQAAVLQAYRDAAIKVGKVQISNAIRVPFDEYSEAQRREAFVQLSAFAEDRYLHQTMIRSSDGQMRFFEDLPLALASVPAGQTARGEWRVHFHVPLFLERFGLIQTTQQQIGEFMGAIRPEDGIHHFETETYAWNVLPLELRTDDLAAGIARELQWVIDHFGRK